MLRKNEYPNKVIDREVERFINDKYCGRKLVKEEDMKTKFLSLPYFGEFPEDFRKRLVGLVESLFPSVNLKITYKAPKTIDSYLA